MKFNNFILRILTSLGLIGVFIFSWLKMPKQGMFFLVSVFVAVLIWEYYKLVFYKPFSRRGFIGFFLWIFGFYLFFMSPLFFSFLKAPLIQNSGSFLGFDLWKVSFFECGLLFFYGFLVFSFWRFYFTQLCLSKSKKLNLEVTRGNESAREDIIRFDQSEKKMSWIFSFLALFYIAFPAGWFLNVFFRGDSSSNILLVILSLVFSGDIFSYIGGQLLKGKKWVPFLSPGKTWSGLFCGLGGSGLVSGFGFGWINKDFSLFFPCFLLGVFGFLLAQTGDLFASLLKRRAGVKDSSSLLPGHGGVLDRLDGFLLAFPCVYFLVNGFM